MLINEHEISNLIFRYNELIDSGDLKGVASLFKNAQLKFPGIEGLKNHRPPPRPRQLPNRYDPPTAKKEGRPLYRPFRQKDRCSQYESGMKDRNFTVSFIFDHPSTSLNITLFPDVQLMSDRSCIVQNIREPSSKVALTLPEPTLVRLEGVWLPAEGRKKTTLSKRLGQLSTLI